MSGSGGAGGYDYQADAFAYVATHTVCEHRLGWFDDIDDTPTAILSETDGPGDDLGIETRGGDTIEVQAKHGLSRGSRFDEAVQRIIAGLKHNPLLRGVLVVDSTTSGPIRDEFRNDVLRLADGRTDGLKDVTREVLRLLAPLIETDYSVFRRFRVIVSDLAEGESGRGVSTVLLREIVVEPNATGAAWDVLGKEGFRQMSRRGRRDAEALIKLLATRVGLRQRAAPAAAEASDRSGALDVDKALDGPPESPRSSCQVSQLPPSLPDFTGRKGELERIVSRLRAEGGAIGACPALGGMGGVGKTKTAIEACWRVKDHFPDAVLFVELRGMSERPVTAVEAMARVIRDIQPETGELPDDEGELRVRYRRALAGKKTLILLDDARDENQVTRLLDVGPPAAFVVTSRKTLGLGSVTPVRLDVLPSEDALALLRGVGARGTDDELRDIAELCGRLPLALRVAGQFIGLNDDWTVRDYRVALAKEADRLKLLRSVWADEARGRWEDLDSRAGAGVEVEAVLALSARRLVTQNAEQAGQWQALSLFANDFDARAAAAVWDMRSGDRNAEGRTHDDYRAAHLLHERHRHQNRHPPISQSGGRSDDNLNI